MKRVAKALRPGDVFKRGQKRRTVVELTPTGTRMIVNVKCTREDGSEVTLPYHRNEKVEVVDV